LGSIAHAKMLEKIGVLTAEECSLLVNELHNIIELDKQGGFVIKAEDEDVHTAVENHLVANIGEPGKKLHTARSRNDQVLLDIRLYCRDGLKSIVDEVLKVCQELCHFALQHHDVPIPGRTHFQRAMPSSIGLWAGAFAESLLDDLELLQTAYRLVDQSPLGSAASYGVSLPIDRQYSADLLGFRCVQNNVLYANNSRGKFEAIVLNSLVHVMLDLGKMCSDIIIFAAPEFGYLTLPEKFCPGSSLMPQKRNPCPLELVRAKAGMVQGLESQVLNVIRSLPSGYNRDFQETKRPLMQGMETTLMSLKVFKEVLKGLQVNKDRCVAAFSPELFATDQVLHLVKEGVAFRDAYRQVAAALDAVETIDPVADILSKTHAGATGNLGLDISLQKIKQYATQWNL
jgi:argininosuccinate lyase